MPRQRFIWPDIWTDPVIGRLPPINQLFFIGCFSNADDEGRLLADPAYLKSIIFPYQGFTPDDTRSIRDQTLKSCHNLVLYTVNGVEYLAFRKWTAYQKPKYPKPSKLPVPPNVEENVSSNVETTASNTGETISPMLKPQLSTPEPWVGLGRDGMGRVGMDDPASHLYVHPEAWALLEGTKAHMDSLRGSINSWSKKFGWKMVTEAIRRGISTRGKETNWGYIEGILKDWTRNHITSIDELKARDEIRSGKQETIAAPPPKKIIWAQEDDYGELERRPTP